MSNPPSCFTTHLLMFLPEQIHRRILNWLQRFLYVCLSLYKLDLSAFFDVIADIPYIAIKVDVPYMVANFPEDYPLGKDIDLIVLEENFNDMIERIESFFRSDHGFSIRKFQEKESFRLRFEFFGVLHYQIHVSCSMKYVSSDFVMGSIASRRKIRNFYVPELSYEIIYRLLEYYEHRNKTRHLEYVRKHAKSINWSLFDDLEIKQYFQALIEASE